MKRIPPLSKQLRQFRHLCRQLHKVSSSATESPISSSVYARKIQKLKHSYHQLKGVYSRRRLVRILAGAGLLIGMGSGVEIQAQGFGTGVNNPFGLMPNASTYAFPALADMDNDGDLDLVTGDVFGTFDYFQNTGTAAVPQFGAPVVNPFGLFATPYGNFISIADLDGDGDNDFLVGNGYGNGDLYYYQNTGTVMAPAFAAPVTPAFGISTYTNFAVPTLVDIDGDGDQDLFIGTSNNNLVYHQNTGTAMAPVFAAGITNPFGLTVNLLPPACSFGDIDGDGDFDLLIANYYNDLTYFENTGNATAPAFAPAQTNPFGLTNQGTGNPLFVTMADMDADMDLDLVLGEYTGDIIYIEDTLGPINTAPMVQAPANDTLCLEDSLKQYPFTAMDAEGDSLTLTATSTNQAVIPDANLAISGTAPNYDLTATLLAAGSTSLIITADDGNLQTSDTLDVTVEVCNTAPQIVAPAMDTLCDFETYGPEAFTASDPENNPITVTGTSTNQAVIPDAAIIISGTSPNFTVEATPLAPGSTSLILTVDDGQLTSADTVDLFVDNCVGIEESFFVEAFNLFPNPAADHIRFELDLIDAPNGISYEVLDVLGREVIRGELAGQRKMYDAEVPLEGVEAGVYTLRIHTGSLALTRKFLVQ